MKTKIFAEENAGKFFMYGGERCRLVGIEDSPLLAVIQYAWWGTMKTTDSLLCRGIHADGRRRG